MKVKVGWGRLGINDTTGDEEIPHPRLKDRKVSQFIYAHAGSEVVFRLRPGDRRFTATALSMGSRSIRFTVWADRVLATQDLPAQGEKAVTFDVELPEGAEHIALVADPMGDINSDISFWVEPRIHGRK